MFCSFVVSLVMISSSSEIGFCKFVGRVYLKGPMSWKYRGQKMRPSSRVRLLTTGERTRSPESRGESGNG